MDRPPHTLGIFAKAPVPGEVKTRLAAEIGKEAAAAWYTKSMQAVFRMTAQLATPVERVLFYDPPNAERTFADMPGVPEIRVAQGSGDLGARMHHAFVWCFDRGARVVALIGTDAPTLPPAAIEAVWTAMETVDIVLGPATDGGYYLIALREPQEWLFTDMAWSTDTVLGETVGRATAANMRVHRLVSWQDVDTAADLAALGPEWAPPEDT